MRLAIDIGNGFSLAKGQKYEKRLESIYHPWRNGERPPSKDESFVGIKGLSYVLGEAARNYRTVVTLAESEKVNYSLPFCLGLLPANTPDREFELVLATPDPDRNGDILRKNLNGTFSFSRSPGGATTEVRLRVIDVLHEGYGAYLANRPRLPQKGLSIIIDIGAGTANALLVRNDNGKVIDTFSLERLGAVYLANSLADDTRFRRDIGSAPLVADIFTGFVRGSLEYGETEISYAAYMPELVQDWGRRLMDLVRNHYSDYMSRVTKIMFTGGGSLFMKEFIDKKPQILMLASDPLKDNVNGMATL